MVNAHGWAGFSKGRLICVFGIFVYYVSTFFKISYLNNLFSWSIYIWTTCILKGRLFFHDIDPGSFFLLFVLFGHYVAFNNLSVLSRRCLDVGDSSMLTFWVLPHWNITPQTLYMIFHRHIILTLRWTVLIPSSTFLILSAKQKSS